jgi:hypothetical protein
MVFSNENSKNNNDDKIKKNENNVTTKKVNLNVEEINFNLDEISLAIGNNQTEEYKKTIETIIEKIKSKNSASFFINQILLAKKVVIASKNGFILLFDNMIDAELFNSFSCKLDSLKEIENEFSKPMYIVGFTKETLDDFVLKFKEQHNKIKKIPEPNIETLVDFIKKNKKNNNSEIFEMAQKLFGDE